MGDNGLQGPVAPAGPQLAQPAAQKPPQIPVAAPESANSTKNGTEEVLDAQDAHKAVKAAMSAAKEANEVATDSIHLTVHAQNELQTARDAVQKARVTAEGLSPEQKLKLKSAEAKLSEATKAAEYGAEECEIR